MVKFAICERHARILLAHLQTVAVILLFLSHCDNTVRET